MCRKYSSLKMNWFQAIHREKLWPLISGQRQKLGQKFTFGKRNRNTESRKASRCCTWRTSAPPAAARGGQPRLAAGSPCPAPGSLQPVSPILLVCVKYRECGMEQGGRILCTHTEPIVKISQILKQSFQNMRYWWPSAALRWEESLKTMIITIFTNIIAENLISTCTSFLKFLSSSCSLSFSVQAKPTTHW